MYESYTESSKYSILQVFVAELFFPVPLDFMSMEAGEIKIMAKKMLATQSVLVSVGYTPLYYLFGSQQ